MIPRIGFFPDPKFAKYIFFTDRGQVLPFRFYNYGYFLLKICRYGNRKGTGDCKPYTLPNYVASTQSETRRESTTLTPPPTHVATTHVVSNVVEMFSLSPLPLSLSLFTLESTIDNVVQPALL